MEERHCYRKPILAYYNYTTYPNIACWKWFQNWLFLAVLSRNLEFFFCWLEDGSGGIRDHIKSEGGPLFGWEIELHSFAWFWPYFRGPFWKEMYVMRCMGFTRVHRCSSKQTGPLNFSPKTAKIPEVLLRPVHREFVSPPLAMHVEIPMF